MKSQINTGVEEKEQWRERITRALQELRRGDEAVMNGRMRNDQSREDTSADASKL